MLRPAPLDPTLIGQTLPWDLYTESGVLVAGAGRVIANEADFQRLSARPLYLRDDGTASDDTPLHRLEAEAARAEAMLYAPTRPQARALYASVDALLALARDDGEACFGYLRLVPVTRPALRHCLKVLFLAHAVARHLEFTEQETFALAGAALTMHLADMEAHDQALRTEPVATALARAGLAEHPLRAAAALRALGVDEASWLDAVQQHHESMDGSGLPAGLAGAEIGLPARILHVADSYCLRIASSHYRPATRQPLQETFGVELPRLDTQIATVLLRIWGTRPPGSLLRLRNGEIAAVARGVTGGHPRFVVSFIDARQRPLEPPRERDTHLRTFTPRADVQPDPSWTSVNWKRMWGY